MYNDGTIRWYNIRDGKELLALFVHKDLKRWVLWTPEGFFDSFPEDTDLVGMHLNRGKETEATFFSMNKLFNTFYRPDLVEAKFNGKNISNYTKQFNIKRIIEEGIAPKVEILTEWGRSDKKDIILKAKLCDRGGG